MIGDWADCSRKDEIRMFLREIDQEFYKNIEQSLFNNHEIDENQLLDQLKLKMDPEFYSLLLISLKFRLFQPKTSLKYPNNKRNPVLKGLQVLEKTKIPSENTPGLKSKIISHIFSNISDSTNKYDYLLDILQNFPSYSQKIANSSVNNSLLKEFQSIKMPRHNAILEINSRQVKTHIYDFLYSLIEEFKFQRVISKFNLTKEQIERIHEVQIGSSKPIYVETPSLYAGAVVRDVFANQIAEKWDLQVDLKRKGVDIFYTKKNLLTVQLFIKLFDKLAKKILQKALDELQLPQMLTIVTFPIFRASNLTEIEVAFAFKTILRYFGGRTATQFLLDGLEIGYKDAYEKIGCEISWNLLNFVMEPSTSEYSSLNEILLFINKHNITENMMFVNGNPIFTDSITKTIDKVPMMYEKMTRSLQKKGLLENVTIFNDQMKNESIILDKLNLTAINSEKVYTDISRFSIDQQLLILKELEESEIIYMNQNETQRVHVFLFGNINESYVKSIESASLSIILHHIQNPSKVLKKFIRSREYNTCVLIGAQIFNYFIDYNLINFYINDLKSNLINDDYESNISLYLTMWRQVLISRSIISEVEIPKIPKNLILTKGNGPFKIDLYMNPFDETASQWLELLKILSNYNLTSVRIVLTPSLVNEIPEHMKYRHLFDFNSDCIDVDNENFILKYPNNFIVQRESNKVVVKSIGSISKCNIRQNFVEINNKLLRISEEGYFMTNLRVGAYNVRGLEGKSFKVDSFSQYNFDYIHNGEQFEVDPSDNQLLNVYVSTTNNFNSSSQLMTMIYSLVKNTQLKTKFYIVGSNIPIKSNKFDFEFVPIIFPPTYIVPENYDLQQQIFKFLLLDIVLPPNIENILILNQNLFWKGNAGRFLKLNLKDSVIAMPDISNDTSKVSNKVFMSEEMKNARKFRPYHSSALSFVNFVNWQQKKSSSLLRKIYFEMMHKSSFIEYDDELINLVQDKLQFLTLPIETCFCDFFGDLNGKKPLCIHLCSNSSYNYIDDDYERYVNEAISYEL